MNDIDHGTQTAHISSSGRAVNLVQSAQRSLDSLSSGIDSNKLGLHSGSVCEKCRLPGDIVLCV